MGQRLTGRAARTFRLRIAIEPSRFATVYERHVGAVHDYLRRRVGEGPAEDLAAEVFVRAFRGRSRYGVQYDSALPWVLGRARLPALA